MARTQSPVVEEQRPIAVCRCGSPLISTFAFRGVEWYCLDCGQKYAWFMEDEAEWTPELAARRDALKAEARPLLNALLVTGSKRTDCSRCDTLGTYHDEHATEEERAADLAARQSLADRASA